MKAKILQAGIMAVALFNSSLQANPPSSMPTNATGNPNQGYVDAGDGGQSMAPVDDTNMVPGYDIPPAYPDSNQGSMNPPSPAGSSDNMIPPPPPSDIPSDASMPIDGSNGSMMPPPPPRRPNTGPGPAGMPPPPGGQGNMPQDVNGPAGGNMLPPTNSATQPGAKNTKTTKVKPSAATKKGTTLN